MHEVLHISILASTILGAAALALLLLWPALFDFAMPVLARGMAIGAGVVASLLLLVEWQLVH